MPPTKPLWIFLHIPKAAGSTLQAVIYNNYPPEEIYWIDPDRIDDSLAKFAGLTTAQQARIRILGGHLAFGVHHLAKRPCRYFTMLRDPVERVISMYHYIRTDPRHFLYNEVCSLNLYDFVNSRVSAQFDNGQTRLLDENLSGPAIGSLERADYKECTAECLDRAKTNLKKHFAVAGIAEKFDASLILLQKTLGWRRVAYTKKNVGASRPQHSRLERESLRAITETNRFDLELYRYARELLKERIAAGGMKLRLTWLRFKLLQALGRNRFWL